MKKRFSIFFTFLLILSLVLPSVAMAGDYNGAKIDWFTKNDYVKGRDGGDLALDEPITRAEFIKVLLATKGSLAEAEAKKDEASKFLDVAENHWAKPYINLALDKGLVKGDASGLFNPNAKISYNEILAILSRLDLNFKEGPASSNNWASQFIEFSKKNGYLNDVSLDDSVLPNSAVRGKTFEIVWNQANPGVRISTTPAPTPAVENKVAAGATDVPCLSNDYVLVDISSTPLNIGDINDQRIMLNDFIKRVFNHQDKIYYEIKIFNDAVRTDQQTFQNFIDESFMTFVDFVSYSGYVDGVLDDTKGRMNFWCEILPNGNMKVTITPYYISSVEDRDALIGFAKDWVAKNINSGMSEKQKVDKIFNYVASNHSYLASQRTAIGMVRTKKGNCAAYSGLFEILAKEAGIDSVLVYDKRPQLNHLWNMVKIDGNWYHIDATWAWNSPQFKNIKEYYLVSDKVFGSDVWAAKWYRGSNGRTWPQQQNHLPKAPHSYRDLGKKASKDNFKYAA